MDGKRSAACQSMPKDMWGVHICRDAASLNSVLPPPFPSQLQLQPLRHVAGAGDDAPGRAAMRPTSTRVRPRRAVGRAVRRRDVGGRPAASANVEVIVSRHAERLEDARLDELVPGLARHARHDLAGGDEHDVVVAIAGTEIRRRLQESRAPDDLLAAVGRAVPQQVAAVGAESAAVRQQVAHADLLRHPRVVELEPGQVRAHAVVPAELLLVDEHRRARRR